MEASTIVGIITALGTLVGIISQAFATRQKNDSDRLETYKDDLDRERARRIEADDRADEEHAKRLELEKQLEEMTK